MIKTVYLAGPISGLSYQKAIKWRDYVTVQLRKVPPSNNQNQVKELLSIDKTYETVRIETYSPLRFKSYLTKEQHLSKKYDHIPLSSQRGIMSRDHNDCMMCDLLFFNLLKTIVVSIGTVMEIAWGHAYRKPMILIMDDNNVHDHPMIKEACPFIVNTLDEGIELTRAILLAGEH